MSRVIATQDGMPGARPRQGDTPRISHWLIAAVWSVPAVLSTFETVTLTRGGPQPMTLWRAFLAEAPGWYAWAALTPAVIYLGRRFPLDRRQGRGWSIFVHALASLGASALVAIINASANTLVRPSRLGFAGSLRGWFLSGLPATTLAYFAVLGVSHALLSTMRLRVRERDAEQLAAQLAEAQLTALRMQLQPHFLFNCLNAIMALVRDQQTERAVAALSTLGEILRTTLATSAAHEVPLCEELVFITRYLELEQVRYADRLRVVVDVPHDLRGAAVPVFLVQPLVENALRHGIMRRREGGTLRIAAARQRELLRLTVEDDGRGLAPDWAERQQNGLGLSNTRGRLARMYGPAAQLLIANGAGRSGGVTATILLPYHEMPESEPAIPGQSVTAR
ncbi:MAG TPA: histidine kinase [Gemmatimonadaceae bacterium]|nr:histidine kinase [Gemmatimonadaceae bacterium]